TYPKMNLKNLHTEDKAVQTQLLLNAKEGKVVSLQIASGKQLKEHVSKVPALLICVTGKGIYTEASGKTTLEPGDYVIIKKDVKHQVDALTDSNFILVK
ncbi:MAG: cupin domain-containing protein, partial [Winogradskyella sp.]